MSVVITAKDVGVEFYTSRRRKMQVRDLLFHGRATTSTDTFWALKDISFEITRGEAVGLVGGNGSGKSTLLKTIAGVLLPDRGTVDVNGGVAPLIELTGGFRGELTCRDNLWVQAGLHGLSKAQIEERFEDIVDFAGPQVRAALDRPYRHLSSGMQVRLRAEIHRTGALGVYPERQACGDKEGDQRTLRLEHRRRKILYRFFLSGDSTKDRVEDSLHFEIRQIGHFDRFEFAAADAGT